MPVTVKIFSQISGRATLYASRTLDKLPITIGRDGTCTIAVEDPKKHLSRFHVEIDEQDGVFWMEVVSKVNPVTVKGRRHGPGTRLTVSSGDIFEMGEYQVQLILPEKKAAADTEATMVPRKPAPAPEVEATMVPGRTPPPAPAAQDNPFMEIESTNTPMAQDDEALFAESTYIAGEESSPKLPVKPSALPPKPAPPPPKPAAPPPPPQEEPSAMATMVARRPAAPPPVSPKPAVQPASQARPAPPPAPVAQAAPEMATDGAFRAFLEGAGMPYKELSAAESERLMRDTGSILRAAVEGLMMLLIARAEMRKEFQAEERTMVAARDNNPLKLMSDPHEAMAFLFDPAERTDGFLDPVQAIGDACEDLRSHEIALMAAMRAAILGSLRRLDPVAIEKEFDKDKKQGFSLASKKAKLWEFFLDRQAKLSQEAQEDFSKVFGRDFMAAYQTQLRRMKGGL